jgi:hypothetical protein
MINSEDEFLPFFQKNISIVLENKTLRQGKLLLFCIKDFYLNFTLLHNNVTKVFELPYPFNTYYESLTSNVLILDYKYKTFTRNQIDIDTKAKPMLAKNKHMKYFDSVVKVIETPV